MELETINKLYLELSQVATAKTAREIKLYEELVYAMENITDMSRQNAALVRRIAELEKMITRKA